MAKKAATVESLQTFTVQEVAVILKLSEDKVVRLIEEGSLAAFNTNPKGQRAQWRVTLEELQRFMGKDAH